MLYLTATAKYYCCPSRGQKHFASSCIRASKTDYQLTSFASAGWMRTEHVGMSASVMQEIRVPLIQAHVLNSHVMLDFGIVELRTSACATPARRSATF